MAQSGVIQSVDRAMQILQVLREAEQPMALRDICEKIPLSKSTVFGLLNTLWMNGMVQKTKDSKYSLGLKLFEYGSCVKKQFRFTDQTQRLLRRLSEQTNATVVLSTRDKSDVLILEQIPGKERIRIALDVGTRLPIYCTAQGKCFLANMPKEELDQILSQELTGYTPYTIQDREALLRELQRVRWRGAAVGNGEYRLGIRAVSAPILNADGQADYAVGVVGLFRTIESDEFAEIAKCVQQTASALSAEITPHAEPLAKPKGRPFGG